MLINFDQASLETSHLTDIESFGDLLKGMVQQCSDNWQVNHSIYIVLPWNNLTLILRL